jgi:hypothetical protein
MSELGVNTSSGAGLVIGAPASCGLAWLALAEVRAAPAGAEVADALPVAATNAPDRVATASMLTRVRERVRRFIIRISSLGKGKARRR